MYSMYARYIADMEHRALWFYVFWGWSSVIHLYPIYVNFFLLVLYVN